jgi:hypothetical protein
MSEAWKDPRCKAAECRCGGDAKEVRATCPNRMTTRELGGEIINLLQAYATDTGCPPGGDVIEWYAAHRLEPKP